jgi:hypothetical protein
VPIKEDRPSNQGRFGMLYNPTLEGDEFTADGMACTC